MRHPTADEWAEVAAGFGPDWLQTDVEDFEYLELGAVARMPVYRDTPALDVAAVAREAQVLFEAARSGAGERADWDRAAALARSTRLMLAGGLDPENVRTAIETVQPWGVDVSSGVERERGVKDPGRIAAFLRAARETED